MSAVRVAANDSMPDDEFFDGPWTPPSRVDASDRAPAVAVPAPWVERVVSCADDWFTQAPPRREWLLRDARAGDAGVLPRGKVGLLIAEGGAGKTMVLVQLAVSVASHEPTSWLGCYAVPDQGRVLLILGEEDAEEAQRRLYNARRAMGAPVPEPGSIVVVPLAGLPCAMIESDERGNPIDAPFLGWLRSYLKEHGPFALVIVGPLSRFAGLDAETDNAAATRFVQALESMATETGATVLCDHHTNKGARGNGAAVSGASSRGSSAITDGVRWVASLAAERVEMPDGTSAEIVTFSIVKSNYARKGDPVTLRRDEDNGGALIPLTAPDRDRIAEARAEADPSAKRRAAREAERDARHVAVDAALRAVLIEQPGMGTRELRAALAARLGGCSAEAVADALARAGDAIRRETGPGRAVRHFVEGTP